MWAHGCIQVTGQRIVGAWMQMTSMAKRRVDDIEVCRDGSMCECLHKHSTPERRAQAPADLAHTGKVALCSATAWRRVWAARRARARGSRRGAARVLRPVPAQRTRTQGANTHVACTHRAGPQFRHRKQSSTIAIVVFAQSAIAQGAWSQNVSVQSRAARGVGTPGVCAGADGGVVRS